MVKKGLTSGAIYLLLAILFAVGAISKTISGDSIVLAMQRFCALVFVVMGSMHLRKNAFG